MDDVMTTAPMRDLTQEDLAAVRGAWASSDQIDSPWLQRREPRDKAALSLRGVLRRRARQSVEPMVWRWVGVDRHAGRSRHCCSRLGAWEAAGILPPHGREVAHDLGADDGVWRPAGRDVPTQGQASVGVTRQDCGPWGKRATGQAGVLVGSARRPGDTWLARRWSRPAEGLTEAACAERRLACGLPAETTLRSTPAVALAMSHAVVRDGTLRCRGVTADEACGRDTVFVAGVAACGRWSVAAVPHDTRGGLARPATVVPAWRGQGRKPTQPRLAAAAPTAQTVAAIAAHLPPETWHPHLRKAGSPGPLLADLAGLRVVAVRDSWPGPDVGLLLRRPPETGARNTDLATAPVDPQGETLASISGMRGPSEPCLADSQSWLGLGADEGRRGTGGHQPLPLVRLAHCCVVRTRLTMNNKPRP